LINIPLPSKFCVKRLHSVKNIIDLIWLLDAVKVLEFIFVVIANKSIKVIIAFLIGAAMDLKVFI
jgi:hypothetical protein